MPFARATRRRVYLKIGIMGPSGSGKTYSGLQLAFGLAGHGGPVAVIDTENGSASLYAHLGAYDVTEVGPPFTVARYVEVVNEAVAAGYDVLLVDSISHAWAGEGGLLNLKESLDARGGNSFANWAKVSPLHEQFKSALVAAPLHVIVTMRSKQDYVMQEDGKGKMVPVKVGLTPIQREGFEYELSTVFDLSMNHQAMVSKDRTGLFDGIVGRLSAEHGRRLREWLESASAGVADDDPPTANGADPARPAKVAFAREAMRLGHDVLGEGGKPSLARVRDLLEAVLGRGELPVEPAIIDWQEGLRRLPFWRESPAASPVGALSARNGNE
jgi:KaiC/GvpD/RAD55 family RecA-like ATPase